MAFALCVLKSEERHFAEACASQFLKVAQDWVIADKVSTVRTDSARNMIAAERILAFELMLCVAHIIQRGIVRIPPNDDTVCVANIQRWEVVEYKYFVTVIKYIFLVSVLHYLFI